ncbi:IclR family transcriptional regulator domain-containing protein [Paraburkholderia heleia]|uniref:IclR family transcriptional regulator domain-containing protein n=1 Tax=Paraburkholderia heleia TaxID=634127 RepID=UPI0031E21012
MSSEKDNREFVTALARGLDVIKVFTQERPELTLSEVASFSGLTPATARRFLHTLQSLGYVTANGRRFLLTARVLDLSAPYLASMNLQEVAQDHLQDVVAATGDSSSVTILDGTEVVYIATVTAKRAARHAAHLGTRYPAFVSSTGRILLAFQDLDTQKATLAESHLKKFTEKTVVDVEALLQIFADARKNDIVSIEDEFDYGVVSVAVPIRSAQGAVIAAINCSTSPSRVKQVEMLKTREPILREAARKISDALRQYPMLVHSILAERHG